MSDIKVGDKLWYVRTPWGHGDIMQFEVVVAKVGRKWLTLHREDNTRWETSADKDTLRVSDRVQCYPSRDVYESGVAREHKWDLVRRAISKSWSLPEWATDTWLDATIALLPKEAVK